jgi:hypothetical protein
MAISKCDENLERANINNSVIEEKFHWPKTLLRPNATKLNNWKPMTLESYAVEETEEMRLNEIMNGSETHQGLIPMLKEFITTLKLPLIDEEFYH